MIAGVRHCWFQLLLCHVIYDPSDSGSIFSDIIIGIIFIELFALIYLLIDAIAGKTRKKTFLVTLTAVRSANIRFVVFHEALSVKIHFSCFLNRVQMYISR